MEGKLDVQDGLGEHIGGGLVHVKGHMHNQCWREIQIYREKERDFSCQPSLARVATLSNVEGGSLVSNLSSHSLGLADEEERELEEKKIPLP